MAVTKAAMYQVMKVRRLTLWPAFIRGNGDSAVIPGAPLVPQAADRRQIDIIRSAAAGARLQDLLDLLPGQVRAALAERFEGLHDPLGQDLLLLVAADLRLPAEVPVVLPVIRE